MPLDLMPPGRYACVKEDRNFYGCEGKRLARGGAKSQT